MALCSVFGLLDVYHLVATPYYLNSFGPVPPHAQNANLHFIFVTAFGEARSYVIDGS